MIPFLGGCSPCVWQCFPHTNNRVYLLFLFCTCFSCFAFQKRPSVITRCFWWGQTLKICCFFFCWLFFLFAPIRTPPPQHTHTHIGPWACCSLFFVVVVLYYVHLVFVFLTQTTGYTCLLVLHLFFLFCLSEEAQCYNKMFLIRPNSENMLFFCWLFFLFTPIRTPPPNTHTHTLAPEHVVLCFSLLLLLFLLFLVVLLSFCCCLLLFFFIVLLWVLGCSSVLFLLFLVAPPCSVFFCWSLLPLVLLVEKKKQKGRRKKGKLRRKKED